MEEWLGELARWPLSSDAAQELDEVGFVVIPSAFAPDVCAPLSEAYDKAILTANPEDVSIRSSTRVNDFVSRGPEFDLIYIYPPLLAACCMVIGRPFKLSTMHARTLEPGTPAQALYGDVKQGADGWPLCGFILMVDEFNSENGATRFAPASHRLLSEPAYPTDDDAQSFEEEVLALGSAGSMIIFNGSVWHGHSDNKSARRRRSIQGAFIPREARAAINQAARIRPETFERIGLLARYILNVD